MRKEPVGPEAPSVASDVIRKLAVADAEFVLEWLIQMHDCPNIKFELPENIEGLTRRAIKGFSAYDEAEPVPMSDEEIKSIVEIVTSG